MIQQQTVLRVSDNSGAKTVRCIKVLNGFKRRYAKLGDTIVVSVLQLRNRSKVTSKVKKGEIYRAVIIRTKKKLKKRDGTSVKLKSNTAVLIAKRGGPLATRIIGFIPKILRKKGCGLSKFFSISSGLAN